MPAQPIPSRMQVPQTCPNAFILPYAIPATCRVCAFAPTHQPRTPLKQAAHSLVPHDSQATRRVACKTYAESGLLVFHPAALACIVPGHTHCPCPCARHDHKARSSCGLYVHHCRLRSRRIKAQALMNRDEDLRAPYTRPRPPMHYDISYRESFSARSVACSYHLHTPRQRASAIPLRKSGASIGFGRPEADRSRLRPLAPAQKIREPMFEHDRDLSRHCGRGASVIQCTGFTCRGRDIYIGERQPRDELRAQLHHDLDLDLRRSNRDVGSLITMIRISSGARSFGASVQKKALGNREQQAAEYVLQPRGRSCVLERSVGVSDPPSFAYHHRACHSAHEARLALEQGARARARGVWQQFRVPQSRRQAYSRPREGLDPCVRVSHLVTSDALALLLLIAHAKPMPHRPTQSPRDQRQSPSRREDDNEYETHRAWLQDVYNHLARGVYSTLAARKRLQSYRRRMDLGGCTSPRCMASTRPRASCARVLMLLFLRATPPHLAIASREDETRVLSLLRSCPEPSLNCSSSTRLMSSSAPMSTSYSRPQLPLPTLTHHHSYPVYFPATWIHPPPLLVLCKFGLLSIILGTAPRQIVTVYSVREVGAVNKPLARVHIPLSPHHAPMLGGGKILAVNELLLGRNVRAAKVRDKLEQRIEWKGYERVARV
ncbi:hypothetical protein B0H13DRAFT_2317177 [Mycena leptocephala]|nr:hypothetical protein B0H13DRAFT_2317177 [Mycena leptocephala]